MRAARHSRYGSRIGSPMRYYTARRPRRVYFTRRSKEEKLQTPPWGKATKSPGPLGQGDKLFPKLFWLGQMLELKLPGLVDPVSLTSHYRKRRGFSHEPPEGSEVVSKSKANVKTAPF